MTTKSTPRARRKRGPQDGVFKKNGWWWCDYRDALGKRRRVKASPDYETAKALYRKRMTEITRGEVTGQRAEALLLRTFVDQIYWPKVAPTLEASWAERTRAWILDRQLLPRFGDRRLVQVAAEDVQAWYAERLQVVKVSTANKELARLKHLMRRAVRWKYLARNPLDDIERVKESATRLRLLTPEERTLLLDGKVIRVTATDGRTWPLHVGPDEALRLYILFALHTGGRRGELCRLTWADVDLKQRRLTFHMTKGKRARSVPITPTLSEALARRPRPLRGTAPLLPPCDPEVLSRKFARLVQRLGLEDVCFHDLRHAVASELTMQGVPQRVIMEILGHRDPRMTVRYQHVRPEHLRDAMTALDAVMAARADVALGARSGSG